MSTTQQLTPEAAVARITDWNGLDVAWKPLGGGITNHNYVVSAAGRPDLPSGGKYVLRIPGAGTDAFIDREREHHNHVAAAAAGVTPPVLHLLEPEGCTVVPFIEGETMHAETLAGDSVRLGKVVDVIRAYHDKAAFGNEIHVFDTIRHFMDMAVRSSAPLPDDIQDMLALGEQIEQAMARHRPQPVACHNDLLAENFILATDGRMWVIDWEYGGTNDPFYDLGVFCAENPLSGDEERFLITRYCGEMDERRHARMMLYKVVSDLWWSLWAMVQVRISQIDFDYFEYGMDRVARLHNNAARTEFPSWLQTV
jgi:thiamine kinase-like enzyme